MDTVTGPSESAVSADSGDAAARAPRTSGCFLLDGRYWTIKYEGSIVRVRDSAGMRCIAHLLLYQDEGLHVRNLARFARVARAGAWGRERDFNDQQVEMAVVERVKSALELISDFHPALGRHLKASIRTGLFCAYLPEPGQLVSWLL